MSDGRKAITPGHFVVGYVYTHDNLYYLAVDRDEVVTVKRGRLVRTKPPKFPLLRTEASVDALASSWKLTVREVDKLLLQFFAPNPDGRTISDKPSNHKRPVETDWAIDRLRKLITGGRKTNGAA